MDTATATAPIANSELLIRFVEVWHADQETHKVVPVNAIAMPENASQSSASPYIHSDELQAMVSEACQSKSVAFIRHTDSSLDALSEHTGCQIVAILCIPVVRERAVQGAVLLGLSDVYGAIEIWGRDDRDELSISDGHYAGLPSFEYITRYTRFPKGAGLPGGVWKSGSARVARKLDKSSAFIRSFGCDPATVSAAVALPIADSLGFPKSVLMFLQAAKHPLSRSSVLLTGAMAPSSNNDDEPPRFQVETVQPVDDCADIPATTTESSSPPQTEQWTREIESALAIGAPLIMNHEGPLGDHQLVWPIYNDQGLASVLIMTF